MSRPRRTAPRRSACSAPRSASASSSGPALGAAFSHISYTAPIWAAAAITVVATALAWFWLPETVHRAHAGGGSPWRALARAVAAAPQPARALHLDFVYWLAFAVYQTTFALFGARRFGFDAAQTGYLLSAFGFLGVVVQGGLVGPIVRALGEKPTLAIGSGVRAVGWGGSALTHSLPCSWLMLVPGAIGIGLCNATLSTLDQQRRRAAASRAACRARPARSKASAARSVRCGATARCSGSAKATAYGSAALVLARRRGADAAVSPGPRRCRAGRSPVEARQTVSGTVPPALLLERRQLPFEPRDQIVELIDDGQHGVGLAQIDARLLQQLHRIVAAARPEQRQEALARLARRSRRRA